MAFRNRTSSGDGDPSAAPAREDGSTWQGAKQLFGYLRNYRGTFIAALVAMFVTGVFILMFPYLMGELFGVAMHSSGAAESIDTARVLERRNEVALMLAIVLLLQGTVAYFRITWFAKAGEGALADLRQDVFARLVHLPMRFFGERRIGELSSRLAADLSLIRDTLVTTVPQVLRQSITLIGSLVMIFVTSFKLSLFMLACLPVVIIATGIVGRRIRGQSKQAQDEMAESNVIVQESLQGILDVKAFGNERYEIGRYRDAIQRFFGTAMRTAHSRAAFVSFIIFVMFGVITLVVWYGAGLLATPPEEGGIAAADFFRFVLYTVFLSGAMGSLPDALSQVQKAVGATDRVRAILDEVPEPTESTTETTMPRLKGDIALERVSFTYPSRPEFAVLKQVSFSAQAGRRIALVGPSGAGKSTIISLLLRLYDPDSGRICFDDKPASTYPLGALRRQMAIVPQEVLLFGGSIRENIAYGRVDASDEEIIAAARQANAHDFIESFPQGYDTLVGDRGVQLSGGQRQRIAIARAILADPAILILDEATSSLDSESEQQVQAALDRLMAGRTSLIIAHRLATVRQADCIVVLQDGRVVETGTHDELVQNREGVYAMLSRLQFLDEFPPHAPRRTAGPVYS